MKSARHLLTIHYAALRWWRDGAPCHLINRRDDDSRPLCPITHCTVTRGKRFYKGGYMFDARAIARHWRTTGFTCPVSRGNISRTEVKAVAALLPPPQSEELLCNYRSRAKVARKRKAQSDLKDTYVSILDMICSEIVKYTFRALPVAMATSQGSSASMPVLAHRCWDPIWMSILQYRAFYSQLLRVDSSAALVQKKAHGNLINTQSTRVATNCKTKDAIPAFYKFVASALFDLHSGDIIDQRAKNQRYVRVIVRQRLEC